MYWLILFGLMISFLPMMVLSAHSESNENRIQQHIEKRLAAGEKATAYVCSDFTCKMPVTDTESLLKLLRKEHIVE